MDYDALQAAIAAYLHRTDLTAEIITFITRAEQRIGRDARLMENRVLDTVTPVSGIAALPTRFVEMRRISTGSGSSLRILKPVGAAAAGEFGTSGEALAYYLSGTIHLIPSSDTDIDIDYYEYPETLLGALGTATRPILDRYENLYLNASIAEAHLFLNDMPAFQTWAALYDAEVTQANSQAAAANTPRSTSGYNMYGGQPRSV